MKKITIARAGWGTWGHVFPIKSLIEYLNTSNHAKEVEKMYWFWKKASLEEETCKTLQKSINNLFFLRINSWKRRREKSIWAFIKNIKDLFLFSYWILQSLILIKKHKIDVVFCKWGYVALPVVFAAKLLWKRIIVHESDVHPWLVNRIASKYADKSFTWFENVFPKATVVWQILSNELISSEAKPSSKTKVFVMWWSQGSKDLYEGLAKVLSTNQELNNMHFDIVLWKLNQNLKPVFSSMKNVSCYDFLTQKEMWEHYASSDIAITRAGTTSLAEQELFDLKLVMVPIPRTHDQKDNAKRYVKHHEGILLEQDDSEFLKKLEKTLISLKSYKKKLSWRNKEEIINKSKESIITAILYS